MAAHDWVLSLDADEVLSSELNQEILRVLARPELPEAAFQMEMTMVFQGRVFRHGRHAHERHVRLFDRSRAGFNGNEVHEGIATAGPVGRLAGRCLHFSYRDVAHYLAKLDDYSTRGARMLERRGARRSDAHPASLPDDLKPGEERQDGQGCQGQVRKDTDPPQDLVGKHAVIGLK